MRTVTIALIGGLIGGSLSAALWIRLWTRGPIAPPIALMDRAPLLQALDQGRPEASAQRARFEAIAQNLKSQGYLVIDPGWVIAAPEALHVDLD